MLLSTLVRECSVTDSSHSLCLHNVVFLSLFPKFFWKFVLEEPVLWCKADALANQCACAKGDWTNQDGL